MGTEVTDTVMVEVMVIVMAEVITMDTVMEVKVIRTETQTWKVGIIYKKNRRTNIINLYIDLYLHGY